MTILLQLQQDEVMLWAWQLLQIITKLSMPMIMDPGPFQLQQGYQVFEFNLALPFYFFRILFVGPCFQMSILELSQACSLLQKFAGSFYLSSRFVAKFSFSDWGKECWKKKMEQSLNFNFLLKCNKVFTLPSLSSSNEC